MYQLAHRFTSRPIGRDRRSERTVDSSTVHIATGHGQWRIESWRSWSFGGSLAIMLAGFVALAIMSSCTVPGPLPGGGGTTPTTIPSPTTVPTTAPTIPPGPGSIPAGRYDTGTLDVTDVWLDPISGSDAASGSDRGQALRTMGAAWSRVPADLATSPRGIRIRITPGTVPIHSLPNNWYEGRRGTAARPIVIQAADGRGTVTLEGGLSAFEISYLYLLDLRFVAGGSTPAVADVVVHGERVDHLLIRNSEVIGDRGETADMKEGVKVNQSQYVYLEDNDISGGWDNPVDFVAVNYGHTIGNRIHHGGDWCMYVKGGSSYHVVDANEFSDCGTGGFTAGQGTGFEWMTPPYLTYEAMGVEFTNNVVHDVAGAGFGVNGGYNVLFAYNTLHRVGSRSHTVEVVHGGRVCDGDILACSAHHTAGGWGPADMATEGNFVPSRRIAVLNNLIVNPPGFLSPQHLTIANPLAPPAGWNIAAPARVDDDLVIAGNVIWNGPAETPIGIEGTLACVNTNPTCNEAQLRRDNAINTIEPRLMDPARGNFSLMAPIANRAVAVPGVNWTDAPSFPDVRNIAWIRSAAVAHDRAGAVRSLPGSPGSLVAR